MCIDKRHFDNLQLKLLFPYHPIEGRILISKVIIQIAHSYPLTQDRTHGSTSDQPYNLVILVDYLATLSDNAFTNHLETYSPLCLLLD